MKDVSDNLNFTYPLSENGVNRTHVVLSATLSIQDKRSDGVLEYPSVVDRHPEALIDRSERNKIVNHSDNKYCNICKKDFEDWRVVDGVRCHVC